MNGSSRGCDWKMQKKPARSRVKSGKTKESPGSHLLQDMNFLCLKEFYNSIPGEFRVCVKWSEKNV